MNISLLVQDDRPAPRQARPRRQHPLPRTKNLGIFHVYSPRPISEALGRHSDSNRRLASSCVALSGSRGTLAPRVTHVDAGINGNAVSLGVASCWASERTDLRPSTEGECSHAVAACSRTLLICRKWKKVQRT